LVHASSNTTALLLYTASLATRMSGRRGVARALGFAGLGILATGGYLGGYLSFVRGVNVNRTAFEDRPTDWTRVAADVDLADGTPLKATAGAASIMLYRKDGRVHALANTCSHMGGPLGEGTVDDGCVTCPWHGSTFRLDDGSIVRGPASTPQPTYEVRVADGQIEVRASAAS
jgi:nitrite reductase/ring-hydroxylating ferredoxin subunit